MAPRNKLIVTLALLLFLGGLGAADYLYRGNEYVASVGGDGGQPTDRHPADLPPGAVAKNTGPSVEQVIAQEGLSAGESADLSLLGQVVTDGTPVRTITLLHDGDRAGSVIWVETGRVKDHFIALKDALINSFSPEMRDLRDETVTEPGKPVRNVLTFTDPALSEERIVFVRVRERLFEFHVAKEKEATMNAFIEALTTK